MTPKLDDTDREILSILRDDARTPVATLAHKVRVSRGTIQNRLRKMEEGGVIVGYTLRLRPDSEPQRIRAWMSIAVEGNAAPEVIRTLRGEPTVGTLHTTNGRWDIVAEVRAESLEAFDAALTRIRLTPGIGNTETSILLSTYKV
jgi:DNA-binding Lrp family transcriptional regulator